jgi:hypothetical protein
LGLPAKLAVIANGVAPGLISDLLAAGNEWLLPREPPVLKHPTAKAMKAKAR